MIAIAFALLCNFAFIVTTDASTGYPELLLANRKDIRIKEFGKERSWQIISKDVGDAASIDYYYKGRLVCWSDVVGQLIQCAQFNVTNVKENKVVTVIKDGVLSPEGLAVDWLAENIYWTDSEANVIQVAQLYGKSRRVLFWKDLDQPRAIVLVPSKGLMFWSDWGEVAKIERSHMNGNEHSRISIVTRDLRWPNGLTVDYEKEILFWADGQLSYIAFVDFNGLGRTKVIGSEVPHPFSLTFFNSTLYWTDWETKGIHLCSLNSQGICESQQKMEMNLSPMYIHVYSPFRQPSSPTPCGVNNGGCSHLCLSSPSPKNFSCSCPTGVLLQEDTFSCAQGPEEVIFLARRRDIRMISLDTLDFTSQIIPLKGIQHVVAVDFDPSSQFLYWTDDEALNIGRSLLNGSNQQIVAKIDVKNPDGLTVDWIAKNVYWTDTGSDRIEVALLDGSFRKILITEGLDEPRAIAVDPDYGWLFWTDWGGQPKIERSALDGSMRSVILQKNLKWPNGVTVDRESQRIFWCDADKDKLESANKDGSDRHVILSHEIPHVFGISVSGDFVYWSDWQKRSIERVHKVTGENRQLIVDQLPDVMGLKVMKLRPGFNSTSNGCFHQNGGCSHFCFNRPQSDFICHCAIGYELLPNGKECHLPNGFLLYADNEHLHHVSLLYNYTTILPIRGIKEVSVLAYESDEKRVYWSDTASKNISRSFLNGSLTETIIQFGLEYPHGLAIDYLAKNLYWSDMKINRIEVSRLDGTSRKVLIWKDIENPDSITIDSVNKFLFWSEWSSNKSQIVRSLLDGSHEQIIVNNIGHAIGLCVDADNTIGHLYWADVEFKRIERIDINGRNREIIMRDLLQPHALTLFANSIYFADWKIGFIEKADKVTGGNRDKIRKVKGLISSVVVGENLRNLPSNVCQVKNGNCSSLCFRVPFSVNNNGRVCGCPTHFQLHWNGRDCIAPSSFLIISQKATMTRFLQSTQGPPLQVLPVEGVRSVRAIDFNSFSDRLVWIDGRTNAIISSQTNGTGKTIIVAPSDAHPFDVAFDPVSNNIVWSCAIHNVINVTRMDSTVIGTILSDANDQPRFLVVHPILGLVFFVNMKSPPQIDRIRIDGKRHMTVVSQLVSPSSVAVDLKEDFLFWADNNNLIESSTLEGQNRKTLVNDVLQNIFGLSIMEEWIYFCVGQENNSIERVNKITGKQREKVTSEMSHISDIVSVTSQFNKLLQSHPCYGDRKCSHLCLVEIHEEGTEAGIATCSCPLGQSLSSDGIKCVDVPSCRVNEFRCAKGSPDCIPIAWRCDGQPECYDHSDEQNCSSMCPSLQFQCNNGHCVDQLLVCNDKFDCEDKSDESECCGHGEIRCNGRCVNAVMHCAVAGANTCELCASVVHPDANEHSTAAYIVVVCVAVVVCVCLLAVVLFLRRRKIPLETHEMKCRTNAKEISPPCHPHLRRLLPPPSSFPSSSSSLYPHETLNPPPTPITPCCHCHPPPIPPSTLHSYRHYKSHNRPPPPTPCSTDLCDDSDFSPSPPHPPSYYYSSPTDYDSDPPPPPPTPHVLYSPLMSRPTLNPPPPPPSPIASD